MKNTALKINYSPRKMRNCDPKDGWWYEGERRISIYLNDGERTLSGEIDRHVLLSWIKRTTIKGRVNS